MLQNILDLIVIKWLYKKSLTNNKKYKQLAVYTNDFIGPVICTDGYHERMYIEALKIFLKLLNVEPSVFIDCGANIGNHSIYLGLDFNKVVCVEPNPHLFSLLKINCPEKKFSLINKALSNKAGKAQLEIFQSNLGGGAIRDNIDQSRFNVIDIEKCKLDDILDSELHKCTLLKIDVEGHELQVLQGASTVLNNMPIIVFEQNSWDTIGADDTAAGFLQKLGYKFIPLKKNDPIEPETHLKKIYLYAHAILFGYRMKFKLLNYIPPDENFACIVAYHPQKYPISDDFLSKFRDNLSNLR